MTKIFNLKNVATLVILLATTFLVSCIDDGTNEIEGKGVNRFRMDLSDGRYAAVFESFTGEFELFDIWRDTKGPAELAKSGSVTFEIDNSIIEDYNATAEPADQLTIFDASYYSIEDFTIDFAAGEFKKSVPVTLSAPADLDLSKAYAIGVKITDVSDGYEASNLGKTAIISVLVKNKWDGVYTVTGTMSDVFAPTLTGFYPFDWELETISGTEVACYYGYFEDYYHPITSAGSQNAYGAFGLIIEFDPATDKVVGVRNAWGTPSNTRAAALDDTGLNKYDPDTKTIDIKYFMLQPSVIPAPPHRRVFFDEKLTFKRKR